MVPVIKFLFDSLRAMPAEPIEIEVGETQMLLHVRMARGAKRRVKVTAEQSRYGEFGIVRLRSRACIARDFTVVRDALYANADLSWASLSLDDSHETKVIDVTFCIVDHHIDIREFILAVRRIATLAARIGNKFGDADAF